MNPTPAKPISMEPSNEDPKDRGLAVVGGLIAHMDKFEMTNQGEQVLVTRFQLETMRAAILEAFPRVTPTSSEGTKLREEIKPVSEKHPLRRAYAAVLGPLYVGLMNHDFGVGKTSARHLEWMCREILRDILIMPLDKMGRWVGFIQGVMAANGVLDVDAERDRTRPLFNEALAAISATPVSSVREANREAEKGNK